MSETRLSRLIEWFQSEHYRRTYGRKADHSRAYAAGSLAKLDGSNAAVVSAMTGLSREELDELGGVPERGVQH